MFRIASALARAATVNGPLQALAETCARTAGCCTQLSDVSQVYCRNYSAFPDPDPEVNGEPSQRVLDLVDSIENLTVRDLVWLNKLLKERLGLDDDMMGMQMAMPMGMPMGGAMPAAAGAAAAAAEPAAPPVAEKTEFKVVVEGYDASAKIKIIKEVRAVLPDLGLKDAKDLVDKIPATIKSGLSKSEADELKAKLEAGVSSTASARDMYV